MIQYENIFTVDKDLYARTYDSSTKTSSLKKVKYTPPVFVKTGKDSELKTVLTKEPVQEYRANSLKEYRTFVSENDDLYGNASLVQNYIRDYFPNPTESNHPFSTWYIDIEVAVDKTDPEHNPREDWKPSGHPRSACAIITSIQIFDSSLKKFIILGLQKDWNNESNFKPESGEVEYFNIESEEKLLRTFLKLLEKRDPTVLVGFNSTGYDYPYLTNRIIRVLDKRTVLYVWDEKKDRYVFNKDCLKGDNVKLLSPVQSVTHKEVESQYGFSDEFEWDGYFLEDFQLLYKKYTYTTLTSYSLSSVAMHELGQDKINHDENADFTEFYEKDFDRFIVYGIQDVQLLISLEEKLKLIELAKTIAYICGVNLSDVQGTIKQWNSFMFNNYLDAGMVLPLKNNLYDDETFMRYAISKKAPEARKPFYQFLFNAEPDLGFPYRVPRFPGGITRGTGKHWKWFYYLDFASLYPMAIQWANIGMDTIILPENLPDELLELRAKYAIFYPKSEASPKDLVKYDFEFSERVLQNPEAIKEMNSVLTKYDYTMTPNGMFFDRKERSILAKTMEDLITQRRVFKKKMKEVKALMKDFPGDKNSEEFRELSNKHDEYDVYQMGLKILGNSAYGALSNKGTSFAGQPEFFSAAVTSTARNANLWVGQTQTMLINKLAGTESTEEQYNTRTYLDKVIQQDTDSNVISIEDILIKKFGKDYEKEGTDRLAEFTLNFVNKVALPDIRDKLDNYYAKACNALLPEKLEEDTEIIGDSFISLVPKRYFCRKIYDEGLFYKKEENKIKVTGLSMISASTPKFFRAELSNSLKILIDGDIKKVKEYSKGVMENISKASFKDISKNQGVTSIDYQWDEQTKKWRRWEGKKFLGAPVNSRAALEHNRFIRKHNANIKEIIAGDKIFYVYLTLPNPTGSNVIGFKDEAVFEIAELHKYIDYNTMFEKDFTQGLQLVTGPLNWNISETEEIDLDDW